MMVQSLRRGPTDREVAFGRAITTGFHQADEGLPSVEICRRQQGQPCRFKKNVGLHLRERLHNRRPTSIFADLRPGRQRARRACELQSRCGDGRWFQRASQLAQVDPGPLSTPYVLYSYGSVFARGLANAFGILMW